jgi:hypothetical protein
MAIFDECLVRSRRERTPEERPKAESHRRLRTRAHLGLAQIRLGKPRGVPAGKRQPGPWDPTVLALSCGQSRGCMPLAAWKPRSLGPARVPQKQGRRASSLDGVLHPDSQSIGASIFWIWPRQIWTAHQRTRAPRAAPRLIGRVTWKPASPNHRSPFRWFLFRPRFCLVRPRLSVFEPARPRHSGSARTEAEFGRSAWHFPAVGGGRGS